MVFIYSFLYDLYWWSWHIRVEGILVTPFVYDWCGLRDRGEDGRPRLDERCSVPKCLDWCPHHLSWRVNHPVSWNVKIWGDRFHTSANILWDRWNEKCFTDKKLEDCWGWKDWFLYSGHWPSAADVDRDPSRIPSIRGENAFRVSRRWRRLLGVNGCLFSAPSGMPRKDGCCGSSPTSPRPITAKVRTLCCCTLCFFSLFFSSLLAGYINKKLLITGKQKHRRLLTWQPGSFSSVISRHLILTFPSSLKWLEYSPA